jgi:hypothetical protein
MRKLGVPYVMSSISQADLECVLKILDLDALNHSELVHHREMHVWLLDQFRFLPTLWWMVQE